MGVLLHPPSSGLHLLAWRDPVHRGSETILRKDDFRYSLLPPAVLVGYVHREHQFCELFARNDLRVLRLWNVDALRQPLHRPAHRRHRSGVRMAVRRSRIHPMGLDCLYRRGFKKTLLYAVVIVSLVLGVDLAITYHFTHRLTIPAVNIVLYNVLGIGGSADVRSLPSIYV